MHLHKVEQLTVRDSSRRAIEVVSAIWDKAGIPVRATKHCIDKLEAVFAEWKSLQKHKSRTTPRHKMNENKFLQRLDDLFDIAHADALDMIKIPEDREFLISQRQKGRPGSIGGVDNVEMNKRGRVLKRKEKELERQKRSQEEQEACSSQVVLEYDSESNFSAAEDSDEAAMEEMKNYYGQGEEAADRRARTPRKRQNLILCHLDLHPVYTEPRFHPEVLLSL